MADRRRALGMYLTGCLLHRGGIDVGERNVGSFPGKQSGSSRGRCRSGILDVVVLLAGADDQDLAPREAPAAERAAAGLGVQRPSEGGHLEPFWLGRLARTDIQYSISTEY